MSEFGDYKVNDKRGKETPQEPCRVCGAPKRHSSTYNTPTMECIYHLRAELNLLQTWLDNNTTYYNVGDGLPVPVLQSASKRIWYHATDDQVGYPFSAVARRAIK